MAPLIFSGKGGLVTAPASSLQLHCSCCQDSHGHVGTRGVEENTEEQKCLRQGPQVLRSSAEPDQRTQVGEGQVAQSLVSKHPMAMSSNSCSTVLSQVTAFVSYSCLSKQALGWHMLRAKCPVRIASFSCGEVRLQFFNFHEASSTRSGHRSSTPPQLSRHCTYAHKHEPPLAILQ